MIVLEKDMSMKFSASSKRFCFSSFPLYFGMLVFGLSFLSLSLPVRADSNLPLGMREIQSD